MSTRTLLTALLATALTMPALAQSETPAAAPAKVLRLAAAWSGERGAGRVAAAA